MTALLEVDGLVVTFGAGREILGRRRDEVRAVDGVGFSVSPGEILALVGESGSGKTTTAHAALGLIKPTAGAVKLNGTDLQAYRGRELRRLRRHIQPIYQDPYEALDPRHSVGRIVEEPLSVHRVGGSRTARQQLVRRALDEVGLTPAESYVGRMPHELSGGQRQRVSIAAALVLGPSLLVADEPVSMLDVSVRTGILDLLSKLRANGLGILMITHDLSTAAHYADRIAVMYLGRIVEIGTSRRVVSDPQHPYTRALVEAVPRHERRVRPRSALIGDVPDGPGGGTGCRFRPRCPIAVTACDSLDPQLRDVSIARVVHEVACVRSS